MRPSCASTYTDLVGGGEQTSNSSTSLHPQTMTSEASSGASSNSEPVTVSPPFSVKPTRTNTGIDGGAAFTQSRWGDAKGRFYIHVPTTFPCDSLWHKPPITSAHGALRQYATTQERENGASWSLEGALPIPAQDALDSLISHWDHNKASQNGPRFAVKLTAYAAEDCLDAPSLMTVAASCARSMVEILQALRIPPRYKDAEQSPSDDVLDGEDLATPLLMAQLKALYPKAMRDLEEVHCAIFGTLEPDGTGSDFRFVADQQYEPHHFSNADAEVIGSGAADFATAFEAWLCIALAKDRGCQ